MTGTSDPCQFLQWDTDFFGYRIARIEAHRLEAAHDGCYRALEQASYNRLLIFPS